MAARAEPLLMNQPEEADGKELRVDSIVALKAARHLRQRFLLLGAVCVWL